MKIFKGILISSIATATLVGTDQIILEGINNKVYAESDYAKNIETEFNKRDSKKNALIVKFKNEIDLPYEDGVEKRIKHGNYDNNLNVLFSENAELTLERLFSSVEPTEIEKLSSHSKSFANKSATNLLNYYKVQVPDNMESDTLIKGFKKSSLVEEVYMQEKEIITPNEIPSPIQPVNPYDDPRFTKQGYLQAAPYGINALYAWGISGGDGKGTTLVDMEYGWMLNHEDLVNQKIELISGQNVIGERGHGTGVLGVMAAEDNQIGDIGIVPKAKVKVISQIRDNGSYNTADAILNAVHHLQPGDILLLEAQASYDGYGDKYLPVEVHSDIFDAIRAGTDKGIIIVETAGNGSNDLDKFQDRNGKKILNRNSPDFKDSGAIMVGAGSSTFPHKRLWYSNYGSRMDVYGWGENVDTTSADPNKNATNLYTSTFSGTSSAGPIIAGAVTSIQGISKQNRGIPYNPIELRNILSDPNTGTKSYDPWNDRIGVLPDLKSILTKLGYASNGSSTSNVLDGNQFTWSLKGFNDREFAKVDYNRTTEKMQIKLEAGVPHSYFSSTYASIKIQNSSGNVLYNKEIVGNRQQMAEAQTVSVKVGDYIELAHIEGEAAKEKTRATLTNLDNIKNETIGKTARYQVTTEGLKKVGKMPETTVLDGNQFAWSLKGYSDREFAKVDYNRTTEKMQIKLEAGVPHYYFNSTYASIKVRNSSGNVLYNKEIVGNRQQIAEMQTVPVKAGDYIELTHTEGEAAKEKTRATLINLENSKQDYIGKKRTYQISSTGLVIK
ncbi:putative mucin/carbohydrate-binding domain-containing protein [Bacillus wiedmannii]|uniref:putative mucin/carbohydrate-binding domain-containing protein n=1 Tax=Bacillus wiedmannii TaxID=1890302 RepID=UPI000B43EAE3|nr:putative mucin/carbohydrate-binding domain-containing protein [Bacillus wiedmannii]OUB80934.1 hypothetical protein BK788_25250 [Bacillus thuringiensis serovar sinensis]